MSGKFTGAIYDLDLPHPKQSILLAMGDHADHQGENIFASVGLIAWKTGYSPRQAQRIMHDCEVDGLLVVTDKATQHKPATYKIVLSAGKRKQPFQTRQDVTPKSKPGVTPDVTPEMIPEIARGDISGIPGVTFSPSRGDIAVSPNTYEPSEEPKENTKEGPPNPQPQTASEIALPASKPVDGKVEPQVRVPEPTQSSKEITLTPVPPAPLPPENYLWLGTSVSDGALHLIEDKGARTNYQHQHTLCGALVSHRVRPSPGLACLARPCPDCQRAAQETNLLVYALTHVTGADARLNPAVRDLARDLEQIGYVAEDVAKYEAHFRRTDWRYAKNVGCKPTPEMVRANIAAVKSDLGQSKYEAAHELQMRIRELRDGKPIGDRRLSVFKDEDADGVGAEYHLSGHNGPIGQPLEIIGGAYPEVPDS